MLTTSTFMGVITTYSYDLNGNQTITEEGGFRTTHVYDKENRLVNVKLHDYFSNVATYTLYGFNCPQGAIRGHRVEETLTRSTLLRQEIAGRRVFPPTSVKASI